MLDPDDRPVQSDGSPPELARALAEVVVTSPAHTAARDRRDAAGRSRSEAVRMRDDTALRIFDLARRDRLLAGQIRRAEDRAERASERIVRIRRSLRELAVANYIGDGASFVLDVDRHNEASNQRVLVSAVNSTQLDELRRNRATVARAETEAELTAAVRNGVRLTASRTRARHDQAVGDVERFSTELLAAAISVEETRRTATVRGADFPLVALDAYVKAALIMAVEDPGCRVPWWALAGIGRIESGHGTSGGAEVRGDGSLTQPILGIALTGAAGTAAIGDTDGGLLDGDASVDRAAGPMQFIPSTWARWARDGNGDGRTDIQNIYDAAASAAAYLCASGPLDNDGGLRLAYFSYNHSLPYVATVLSSAQQYAVSVRLG